jgi:catechol 2,3-dioxygenase-like lactoylglutathione lyase family enzyme
VITGVHALLYAEDPDLARAFFRDVLDWPYVDAHDGWLIFRAGPSEIGIHPASPPTDEGTGPGAHHEVSLVCDDLIATMADLRARGATFAGDVVERRFGTSALLEVPGAGVVLLYQPTHPLALNLETRED